jgi:DNA-binding transcriptional ArsR family regulator
MKPTADTDLLHLLFPHVRAEILRMLFVNPTSQTYGREAARVTTLALRTVQRELAMLEAAGFVTSRKKGSVRLFCANRGHRMFPALQQLVMKGASAQRFVSKAKTPRQPPRRSARADSARRMTGSLLPKPRGVFTL